MSESDKPIEPTTLRCVGCGYDLTGATVGGQCPECGKPLAESVSMATPPATSINAIFSLLFGVVAIGFPLVGLVALLLGAVGLHEARRGNYTKASTVLAIIGMTLGFIAITFRLFFHVVD